MKKIVITGGCGLLGWEFAKSLSKIGNKILILDNSKKKIFERKKDINNKNIIFFYCDITKKVNVKKIVSKIIQKEKKIDILINNACINYSPKYLGKRDNNSFLNFTSERFDKEIDVGLKGSIICCQVIGKYMLKNKYGIIINIGSDLSIKAPDQSLYSHLNTTKPITYSIIKTAIHGLTIYLASLWGSKGIRVNTLSPGGIYNNQNKTFYKKLIKKIPLNRMANYNEYNEVIKFLCSDGSAYMNGHNLIVDGGRTII
jgi:NAD(P)-dependent dehydrogenase (short-subunit alcohol dehydrogenase family)